MDLVAIDQGTAQRFSPETPLQTALPTPSEPYTLGGLMKLNIQILVSECRLPSGLQHM